MAPRPAAPRPDTPTLGPRRSPSSRAAITRAWLAAHTATRSLERLKTLPPLEKLQALVDAGAIVPQAGMTPYRLAMAADDPAALDVLLSGSESLGAESRWGLVAEAARQGATRCLGRMLALDFPLAPPPAPRRAPGPHQAIANLMPVLAPALALAMDHGHVDTAHVLLEAGVAQLPTAADTPSGFARARTPAMVDLLASHGLQPTPGDLVSTGALDSGDPDPDLLQAFLRAGLKVRTGTRDAPIGWAGAALFDRLDQALHHEAGQSVEGGEDLVDRLVACARLLHEAGYPWAREVRQAGWRIQPHALAVLARAGVPVRSLMPRRDARNYVPAPLLARGRWTDPQAGYNLAAEQLRVLARAGVDTDVFWNPSAPSDWKRAMVRAGVLPPARKAAAADLSDFPPALLEMGRQVRLADRLPAGGPARPAPRL